MKTYTYNSHFCTSGFGGLGLFRKLRKDFENLRVLSLKGCPILCVVFLEELSLAKYSELLIETP